MYIFQQLAPWCIPLVISKNPSENEYSTFWKAILEYKIACIVCLLSEIEVSIYFNQYTGPLVLYFREYLYDMILTCQFLEACLFALQAIGLTHLTFSYSFHLFVFDNMLKVLQYRHKAMYICGPRRTLQNSLNSISNKVDRV